MAFTFENTALDTAGTIIGDNAPADRLKILGSAGQAGRCRGSACFDSGRSGGARHRHRGGHVGGPLKARRCRITDIEPNPGPDIVAAQYSDRIIVGTIGELALDEALPETFDVIFFEDVPDHLKHAEGLLRALKRRLRPTEWLSRRLVTERRAHQHKTEPNRQTPRVCAPRARRYELEGSSRFGGSGSCSMTAALKSAIGPNRAKRSLKKAQPSIDSWRRDRSCASCREIPKPRRTFTRRSLQ